MLPIPVPTHFRIIAHRGASAYAPENSFAAFDLAQQMGVPEIELDTQLTTDGAIALCHDSTLARYGHGERHVEEMRWADLQALDMGSWFSPHLFGGERMVTLPDLFMRYGSELTYHVELKGRAPGLAAAVHDAIQDHDLQESCIITSFSYDWLVTMRSLDTQIRMGWLVQQMDEEVLRKAAALDLFQLCPLAKSASNTEVKQAHAIVQEVRAWGLMGETALGMAAEVQALIHNVLETGCDGMTINWPDWVTHETSSRSQP